MPVINMALMPLRVIDVKLTIKNCETGGIHFTRSPFWHVISHTWSLEIRAFSKLIGEMQKSCGPAGDTASENGQAYEALFEAAGFGCHGPAYEKLIEFLIILESQGVSWAWFDAVCINQADKEEKDREIQRMGTYYQKSLGCYVVQHGIGKGFELLLQDERYTEDGVSYLPRWFTRAWTLQEWVLPPWVRFVIDLTSEPYLCTVASIVMKQDPSRCFCCQFQFSISPVFLKKCLLLHTGMHAPVGNKGCTQEGLDLCSSASMESHKSCQEVHPHFKNVPGRSRWYFVDDLGYSFLLRLKFHLKQLPADMWSGQVVFEEEINLTETDFKLTSRIGTKRVIMGYPTLNAKTDLKRVIWEVAERDCSNAEDRVLSVLKLLGVQNAFQVRTGKSLEGQLLHLAKSLGHKVLAWLCLVDGFGSLTPGMSWMPQFEIQKGSWQEGAWFLARLFYAQVSNFQPEVKCEVNDNGMLQLEGEACIADLIISDAAHEESEKKLTRDDEVSMRAVLKVRGQVLVLAFARMFTKLSQCTTCIISQATNISIAFEPEISIAFEAYALHHLRPKIPVWLVKIGVEHGYSFVYWMVCIGMEDGSPLHKIGYFRTDAHMRKLGYDALIASLQTTHCCVGGLGSDFNELLVYGLDSTVGS